MYELSCDDALDDHSPAKSVYLVCAVREWRGVKRGVMGGEESGEKREERGEMFTYLRPSSVAVYRMRMDPSLEIIVYGEWKEERGERREERGEKKREERRGKRREERRGEEVSITRV